MVINISGEKDFYQGRVFGERNSHVNAHIDDGLLTASIVTKDDSYHVEVLLLILKIKPGFYVTNVKYLLSLLGDIYQMQTRNQ